MNLLSTAADAWIRAADKAGYVLPKEVQEARDRLNAAEAELVKLGPPVEPVNPTKLVVDRGMDLAEAMAEHERVLAAQGEWVKAKHVLSSVIYGRRTALNRAVKEHRDEMILGIRPLVTALVDEAREHAETLAPFAPRYAAEDIVRNGSPKTLKAYQAAAEIESRFGTLMAAWRPSFKEAVDAPRPSGFDYRWVDQVHLYWSDPSLVTNPRLNGTYYAPNRGAPSAIQPTVLACACEPASAGFRLAVLDELEERWKAEQAAQRAEFGGRSLGVRTI